MSKRIAFCGDGTWDSASNRTNVYKLFKSLTISADQVPIYDDGVGANGDPISRLLGGAFGTGLWEKIKQGYTKISHVYEQGDEIFIFGFSRGAFTARSLAGMIAACGLPTKNFTDDLVETAFDAYRDKSNRQEKLKKLANCDMFSGDRNGGCLGHRGFSRNSVGYRRDRSAVLWISGHQPESENQARLSRARDG
jgi:uncharacterized protein (DUF2235 family)